MPSRWLVRAVLALLLVLPLHAALEATAEVSEEQLHHALDATVLLKLTRLYRGEQVEVRGSGFFASPEGHVVTNFHVATPRLEPDTGERLSGPAVLIGDISAIVHSGGADELHLTAQVVSTDAARDLALLKVTHKPTAWLRVTERTELRLTEPVWVVGYPYGEMLSASGSNPEVTVTGGRVTALRANERKDLEMVQIDAALNPGNSGGPVIDGQGQLVGVAWARVRGSTGTGFAIPPGKLSAFIAENQFGVRVEPAVVSPQRKPLQVSVTPRIHSLHDVSCEATLTGTNIAQATVHLVKSSTGFAGTLVVPPRRDGAVDPGSYTLVVRLLPSEGGPAIERPIRIPIGSAAAQASPAPSSTPAAAAGRPASSPPRSGAVMEGNALAGLAQGRQLRSVGASGQVIDNQAVQGGRFTSQPELYAALPAGELRDVAMRFDEAENALVTAEERRVAPPPTPTPYYSYGHSWTKTPIPQPNYEAQSAAAWRVFGAVRKEVESRGMCRTHDGRWFVRGAGSTFPETCLIPHPPGVVDSSSVLQPAPAPPQRPTRTPRGPYVVRSR